MTIIMITIEYTKTCCSNDIVRPSRQVWVSFRVFEDVFVRSKVATNEMTAWDEYEGPTRGTPQLHICISTIGLEATGFLPIFISSFINSLRYAAGPLLVPASYRLMFNRSAD